MKTVQMKRGEMFRLERGLQAVSDLKGTKFAYAVMKSLRSVTGECTDMRKLLEPRPSMQAFDEARKKLAEQHADKDESGNAKTKQVGRETHFVITGTTAFEAALEALKAEHKEAFDERAKQVAEFEKFMEEQGEIELHTVKLDTAPPDMTPAQMDGIAELIED